MGHCFKGGCRRDIRPVYDVHVGGKIFLIHQSYLRRLPESTQSRTVGDTYEVTFTKRPFGLDIKGLLSEHLFDLARKDECSIGAVVSDDRKLNGFIKHAQV